MRQRMQALLERPWAARLWQFVKFGIVGVSNTVLSLCVYELCVHLGLHYLAANALGLVISVINAYYWNNRCVFGDGQKKTPAQHLRAYAKSLTAYGGTFALDSALLALWVEGVGLNPALAPILNLVITIPLNFLVNKYWTFGKGKGTKTP